ncbi:MAG: hypothetical protein P8074_09055 [Anaerolineales bacterium]
MGQSHQMGGASQAAVAGAKTGQGDIDFLHTRQRLAPTAFELFFTGSQRSICSVVQVGSRKRSA